jgi:N utilization substance protein B
MSSRSTSRKRAFMTLFELDARDFSLSLDELIENHSSNKNINNIKEYALDIVSGVLDNRTHIDDTLEKYLLNWQFYQLSIADRSILRLAIWEIIYGKIVPSVAISEAMGLAREYSTDKSPQFINGILSKVAETTT